MRRNRWAARASMIAVVVVAALFALAWATMDNPIPPLRQGPGVQLTKGTGYCVSVAIGDRYFGRIVVPLHKPDPAKLDELRVSVANSYRLMALQVKDEADAAALRQAADHVRFAGEPDDAPASTRAEPATVSYARIRKAPNGGGVTCSCSTYWGTAVPGAACGGGCGDCYLCR